MNKKTTYFIDGNQNHIYAIDDPTSLYIIDMDHPQRVYKTTSSTLPEEVVDGGRYLLAGKMQEGITFQNVAYNYLIVDCDMTGLSDYSFMFKSKTEGISHVYLREPIIQYFNTSGIKMFENVIIDNPELEFKNIGTSENFAVLGRLIGNKTYLKNIKITNCFIKENDDTNSLLNNWSNNDMNITICKSVLQGNNVGCCFLQCTDSPGKNKNVNIENCNLSDLSWTEYNGTEWSNCSCLSWANCENTVLKNCIMPNQVRSFNSTWNDNYISKGNMCALIYSSTISNSLVFDNCVFNDPKYMAMFFCVSTKSSVVNLNKVILKGLYTSQQLSHFNGFLFFKSPDVITELDCSEFHIQPTYIQSFFGISGNNMCHCLEKLDLSGMDWSLVALESTNLDTLNHGAVFQKLNYYRSPRNLPKWSIDWSFLGDNLDHDSVYSIIHELPNLTGEEQKICTLSAKQYSLLTQTEIDEAQVTKNWVLKTSVSNTPIRDKDNNTETSTLPEVNCTNSI